MSNMEPAADKIDIDHLSEEELLNLRICDLPIKIKGTWLEECIQELYQELSQREILFNPECYLADEWLTPENEPVLGIPFYLAHPRLIQLERKMMLEVEGETKAWCMKLLRHETGHALTYAYGLNKKKSWQKVFGRSSVEYPETYRFHPYSKNYVLHLENYYAQYHPDEDFVETFAVWLTPGLDWRARYKGWKALDKLEFVDGLMKDIRAKQPLRTRGQKFWRVSTLKITLKEFYKRKKKFWAEDFPDFHDENLKKIFISMDEAKTHLEGFEITRVHAAVKIIKKYENEIIKSVARWTGERRYIISQQLTKILERCRSLKLVTADNESIVVLKFTTYLTTRVVNYQYTGWFSGRKKKK